MNPGWLEDWKGDVASAFQALRRSPGFTTMALVTLALTSVAAFVPASSILTGRNVPMAMLKVHHA
jgi:hypothetical protein